MYEIEVIVTTLTRMELKLTANWPLVWMQAPGSIEILRKLLPGETVPPSRNLLRDLRSFPSSEFVGGICNSEIAS